MDGSGERHKRGEQMKVGLVVLIVDDKALGRAPRYSEVRETALQAEAAGP